MGSENKELRVLWTLANEQLEALGDEIDTVSNDLAVVEPLLDPHDPLLPAPDRIAQSLKSVVSDLALLRMTLSQGFERPGRRAS